MNLLSVAAIDIAVSRFSGVMSLILGRSQLGNKQLIINRQISNS